MTKCQLAVYLSRGNLTESSHHVELNTAHVVVGVVGGVGVGGSVGVVVSIVGVVVGVVGVVDVGVVGGGGVSVGVVVVGGVVGVVVGVDVGVGGVGVGVGVVVVVCSHVVRDVFTHWGNIQEEPAASIWTLPFLMRQFKICSITPHREQGYRWKGSAMCENFASGHSLPIKW